MFPAGLDNPRNQALLGRRLATARPRGPVDNPALARDCDADGEALTVAITRRTHSVGEVA